MSYASNKTKHRDFFFKDECHAFIWLQLANILSARLDII